MSNRPRPRNRRATRKEVQEVKGSAKFFAILVLSTLAILLLLYVVYLGL